MADVEMSKVWRLVSTGTPVLAWTEFPQTEAEKFAWSLSVPNQKASALAADAQPQRTRSVGATVSWNSQTTRVVVLGTMPVSMYCAPAALM